ncbi:phosphoenolpyruvate--protein phosphotransferase [Nocardiopsis ansamitocini]|uniref:phosphoenolpyruvate--protein phosphotransferase n=1 Tax=Nocardiopsis ansamitocini TaxID=1670832 RepID=UPI003D7F616B
MSQTHPEPAEGETQTITGTPGSPGSAVAPVAVLAAPPALPEQRPEVTDTAAETDRAHAALEQVAVGLETRAAGSGPEAAAVLGAQALMARDPQLGTNIAKEIGEGVPAAWAVHSAVAGYQDLLRAAGGYLAERAADLADIRDRTVAVLLGVPMPGLPDPGHPYVLVADDLAPADTAQLDPAKVLAIVTRRGGPTSHTVILARSLGIPAVIACGRAGELTDGVEVAVDGDRGEVVLNPTATQVAAAVERAERRQKILAHSSGAGRTEDGVAVKLLLNVGAEDPGESAAHDCEGVGLLRTEFLFLDRDTEPTPDEQYESYARLFRAFGDRIITVRTLDAGSDKPLAFVAQGEEPNPALGVRGFRTARALPGLLERQLAAIARAASDTGAHVRVMAPMISTPAEAAEFAELARAAGLAEVGVMIEVPGAALLARQVLDRVDFVSIGTNDLAQYTLATDRMLDSLPDLLDPWQPGLLRLIQEVGTAGVATDKPVGVCGEAAADPLLALVLVGLGVSSLSMSAPSLAAVRYALARHTLADCRDLAELALAAAGPAQARDAVRGAADDEVAGL